MTKCPLLRHWVIRSNVLFMVFAQKCTIPLTLVLLYVPVLVLVKKRYELYWINKLVTTTTTTTYVQLLQLPT